MRHLVMLRSADASAPAQPVGLTATGPAGATVLTWDASADPYPGSGLKEYVVNRDGAFLDNVATTPGLSLELNGADVGTFTPAGSSSVSGASVSLTGAGDQIYNTADQFRYVAGQVTGDCVIYAQVTAFESASNGFSKAGLMFRESLAANAAFVHCLSFPFAQGNGVKIEYRPTTGASTTEPGSEVNLPSGARWLKHVRAGNSFTSYYSTTGGAWTLLGTVTVALPATCYVGLAVGSESPGNPVTAQFANVAVTNSAQATYTDTTGAGTNSYTVAARDVAGNVSAFSTAATVGGGTFNPAWPRLGAVPINDQRYDLEAQRAHWSRFHIVCFTHYNGWQSGRSLTMSQVMADMKARAPASMGVTPIHVVYVVKDELPITPDAATQILHDKINAENWWLRTSFPGGSIVPHEFPGNYVINDSIYCPNDSSGRNWNLWKADRDYTQNVVGDASNSPNPNCDGVSCDVIIWKPRWDGDYNRDGSSDSQNSPTIQLALRQGQKQYYDRLQSIWPNGYRLANTDFGDVQGSNIYSSIYTANPLLVTPMNGVLHGSQMEYFLSDASSPYAKEYQTRDPINGLTGFYALRNAYSEIEAVTQAPKLNIFFDHQAFRGDTPSAWQATRFGMACCWVLGDAYVYQHPDSFSSALTNWADEYDNAGTGHGYLGYPTGAYTTLANGVCRRTFTNGVVLLNPRNNGVKSVQIEFATRRIAGRSGFSDTSVNNGALVPANTTINLQDRDGLVLLRA